jgi:cyclic pyranopterin monophosphate synthase
MELSHIDHKGNAKMVDISNKEISHREAIATGMIHLQPATIALINENNIKKGDVLSVARIAGIAGAKKTSSVIPLCHTILINHISIEFTFRDAGIFIEAKVISEGKTGVEMEALTAVSTAALTIYDMCKAVDKSMRITDIVLSKKIKRIVRESE